MLYVNQRVFLIVIAGNGFLPRMVNSMRNFGRPIGSRDPLVFPQSSSHLQKPANESPMC